jgi:pyruvate, orthophosphate dikinase
MSTKYVYLFREGDQSMKNLLGGKGANLAEMSRLGLSVPNGFTVTTEACNVYYDQGKKVPNLLVEQMFTALIEVEKDMGKVFGDNENPFFYLYVQVLELLCQG